MIGSTLNLKPETVTLILINLAGIMENADESLLPGVYKEVGRDLHTDPTGLGSLTLFRSIVQSLCYPLAAYLALRRNRCHVIALGAFLWSAATFLVSFSSTFSQVAVSRGLNGIGLALVIPSIHSLIADLTDETNRGITFGWLQLTGNVGTILGGLFSVLLASTSLFGIAGWRIAFLFVGLISVIVGTLVYLFATDPRFESSSAKTNCEISNKPFWADFKDMLKQAKSVMKIKTFQVIVAQGIAGSFAGAAFSFAPMWLELIGFSHNTVAFIWTLFVVGFSIGGLFGGKMGDILSQRYPNSGRIILSQISSGSAIPLAAILLLSLPDNPSTAFLHGLVFFVMGVSISWNAPATNNPIFAEIVPKQSRTTIYALDQSFESILSSFAPPLVGILAQQVYGYKPVQNGSTALKETETDRENAIPLAKALYAAIGVPYFVCCVIYSLLYFTYPRDRDQARAHALMESEMELIGLDEQIGIERRLDFDDEDEKIRLMSS